MKDSLYIPVVRTLFIPGDNPGVREVTGIEAVPEIKDVAGNAEEVIITGEMDVSIRYVPDRGEDQEIPWDVLNVSEDEEHGARDKILSWEDKVQGELTRGLDNPEQHQITIRVPFMVSVEGDFVSREGVFRMEPLVENVNWLVVDDKALEMEAMLTLNLTEANAADMSDSREETSETEQSENFRNTFAEVNPSLDKGWDEIDEEILVDSIQLEKSQNVSTAAQVDEMQIPPASWTSWQPHQFYSMGEQSTQMQENWNALWERPAGHPEMTDPGAGSSNFAAWEGQRVVETLVEPNQSVVIDENTYAEADTLPEQGLAEVSERAFEPEPLNLIEPYPYPDAIQEQVSEITERPVDDQSSNQAISSATIPERDVGAKETVQDTEFTVASLQEHDEDTKIAIGFKVEEPSVEVIPESLVEEFVQETSQEPEKKWEIKPTILIKPVVHTLGEGAPPKTEQVAWGGHYQMKFYRIQAGEDIDIVAEKLGIPKEKILRLNSLHEQEIKTGQLLVIPK